MQEMPKLQEMQEENTSGKVKMKILDKLTIHSQNRSIRKLIEELPYLHNDIEKAIQKKQEMQKEDKNRSLFPNGTYESIHNR